jgi:hypothetical protein
MKKSLTKPIDSTLVHSQILKLLVVIGWKIKTNLKIKDTRIYNAPRQKNGCNLFRYMK